MYTEEKNKKLQGHCVDVGDVEVLCDGCNSLPGMRIKSLKDGSSCTWVVLTASAVSTLKY